MVVTLCGVMLGTAANFLSPRRIPWVQDWAHHVEARAYQAGLTLANTEEAWELFQKGRHLFLDARSEKDYQLGHIPGAMSLPQAAYEQYLVGFQGFLTPEQPIVVYCSGLECDESLLLAVELKRMGMTNIVLYAGGFEKWRAAGYPVEMSP